ncbi:MAG TPA: hypothetical protein VFO18_17200 [Methylomirabilota bacterium]|nr:hypothetical protein [Methylomirabilota bacterium]
MKVMMVRTLVFCGVLALATACGPSTKEDIVIKAKNASTKGDLEKALGRPDDIAKLGPIEKWTYKASNGKVVFVIVGDKVTIEATGESEKEKK